MNEERNELNTPKLMECTCGETPTFERDPCTYDVTYSAFCACGRSTKPCKSRHRATCRWDDHDKETKDVLYIAILLAAMWTSGICFGIGIGIDCF